MIPVFVAAQLAQQGLQSVWVPYTTYRYGWSVTDVGLSLAIVGLLFAVAQGALVRPMVARLGELRTLISALVVAVLGMLLFGLATQGWMMYAVTALYCLGLGLLKLLDVFGRVFLEIFHAVFTAKLNLPALMDINVGFAHLTEFFARDHAGLQRVRLGLCIGLLVGGQSGQWGG